MSAEQTGCRAGLFFSTFRCRLDGPDINLAQARSKRSAFIILFQAETGSGRAFSKLRDF